MSLFAEWIVINDYKQRCWCERRRNWLISVWPWTLCKPVISGHLPADSSHIIKPICIECKQASRWRHDVIHIFLLLQMLPCDIKLNPPCLCGVLPQTGLLAVSVTYINKHTHAATHMTRRLCPALSSCSTEMSFSTHALKYGQSFSDFSQRKEGRKQ